MAKAQYNGTQKYTPENGNNSSLELMTTQMGSQVGQRREIHKLKKEIPLQEPLKKEISQQKLLKERRAQQELPKEKLLKQQEEKLPNGEKRETFQGPKGKGLFPQLTSRHSPGPLDEQLNRKKREEPAEQPGRTNKVSIPVPPQIITETGEQRSVTIYRVKPLPDVAYCGWTHHQTKGEVIWDPKGCDLTIIKEENEWVLSINNIEPVEGEEFIVELARTGLTEGSSSTTMKIEFTPAPNLEVLTTTRTTTTVAAAVHTTVVTTRVPTTTLGEKSTIPTTKPKASETAGFFTDIWNLLTKPNSPPQEDDADETANMLEPEPLKDKTLEEAVKNDWYKWARYTADRHRMDDCILCSKSPLSEVLIVPEPASFDSCANWKNANCKPGKYHIPL